jgi:hypothetical protein
MAGTERTSPYPNRRDRQVKQRRKYSHSFDCRGIVGQFRMAVKRVSDAITAAGSYTNNAAIVWQLNKSAVLYYLGRNLFGKHAKSKKAAVEPWFIPQVSSQDGAKAYDGQVDANGKGIPGADCISISTFMKNVCFVTGLPGTFDTKTFMAFYVRGADANGPAEPDRPKVAVVGDLSFPNLIHPGDKGPSPNGAGNPTWKLFLADSHCLGGTAVDANGNPLPGRVGCTGGLNGFEAAVLYTDPGGKTWFFPGGTAHVYKSKDTVVQIFRTMVWTDRTDPTQPPDPNTNPLKVYGVDYIYNPGITDSPADDAP